MLLFSNRMGNALLVWEHEQSRICYMIYTRPYDPTTAFVSEDVDLSEMNFCLKNEEWGLEVFLPQTKPGSVVVVVLWCLVCVLSNPVYHTFCHKSNTETHRKFQKLKQSEVQHGLLTPRANQTFITFKHTHSVKTSSSTNQKHSSNICTVNSFLM